MLHRSNPPVVPAPIGRYHHAVTVPAGTDLVFLAGQIGNHLDGRPVAEDAVDQARQAFANIAAIIGSLGGTPADIAKFTTLVVGQDGLTGFRTARDEVFAVWYPDGELPANTLIMVAGLASPEIVVEIEAVVALRHP